MTKKNTKSANIVLLSEAYEKEKRLRSYWVSENTEKLLLAATLTREPTNYFEQDVIWNTMAAGMATLARDHEVAARYRRKLPILDAKSIPGIESIRQDNSLINIGVGDVKEDPRLARLDTDLSPAPLMRPVDPNTQRILFKPKPDFGREKYIIERAKQIPEKRYYFPECMSWNHGWRMCDSKIKQGTKFGRNWVLKEALKNRVGLTRDPDYYKTAEQGAFAKCGS